MDNIIDPASEQDLPSFSLRLLVPPLRLMSAFMWQVAQQRNVMQYGKLEEFVTFVTEMVPELLSSRQRTQLILGLRARMVLELCCSAGTADLLTIQAHLNIIHTLTEKSLHKESHGDELEASDSNFVELVQTLLGDPSEREHFFQEVFPVHYGPRYDTALQTLVWEFLSRLEELLPVPDLTQTTAWLSAAPSVLEECGQTVFDPEQLKTVLQHHQRHGNMNKSHVSKYTADTILSTLSLPPKMRVVINYEPDNSDNGRQYSDECIDNGVCENEAHNEILDESTDRCLEDLGLSTSEQQEGLPPAETSVLVIPVPCDELNLDHSLNVMVNADEPCQVLNCTLPPFSHSEMANLCKDNTDQVEKDSKQVDKKEEVVRKGDKNNEIKQVDKKTKVVRKGDKKNEIKQVDKKTKVVRKGDKKNEIKQVDKKTKVVRKGDKKNEIKQVDKKTKVVRKGDKKVDKKQEGSPVPQNRTHTCECGKVFKKPSLLTLHMGVHTMPYHCDQCPKRYATPGALKKHQLLHTEERPFACEHCDRRYRSAYDLKVHVRIHSGERRHMCTICGKRFTQQCALVRHMRMHAGEKNYLCSICGKAFLTLGELRLHTRTHTGENPHTCKHCGKGFKASCHLMVHLRSHTGERPYTCTQCPKSFTTSDALRKHVYTHTGEKPHGCSECGKTFSQRGNMVNHMRRVHKPVKILQKQSNRKTDKVS
ncbi:zinc finger protein 714 isoform X1 [Oncorhynchus mykiss]|uniref:zinc finger protein 714 isoform X1 n=1 Tax=Oncorhynchus mykiss TaxID=8022 RepID=UPI000B4F1FF5|nr:zinc finger protein 714 isoform X1 [Oncorhynchus mykiss]